MTRGDMRGAGVLRSPHPPSPPNRPCPLFNSISHNAHRRHKETFASLSLLFHSLGSVGCAPPVFVSHFRAVGVRPKHRPRPAAPQEQGCGFTPGRGHPPVAPKELHLCSRPPLSPFPVFFSVRALQRSRTSRHCTASGLCYGHYVTCILHPTPVLPLCVEIALSLSVP